MAYDAGKFALPTTQDGSDDTTCCVHAVYSKSSKDGVAYCSVDAALRLPSGNPTRHGWLCADHYKPQAFHPTYERQSDSFRPLDALDDILANESKRIRAAKQAGALSLPYRNWAPLITGNPLDIFERLDMQAAMADEYDEMPGDRRQVSWRSR